MATMNPKAHTKLRCVVRTRMRRNKLNYSELSRLCCNSPSSGRISGWLNGKHDIAASSVETMLRVLDILDGEGLGHLGADALNDL